MTRFVVSVLLMMVICLPALALDKRKNAIVIYEGLHIPIKFVETINLSNLKKGDKVDIAINEDTSAGNYKIFEKNGKGQAFISIKDNNINIDSGELTDKMGHIHPIEIKGFHLKDFEEENDYIIPENYVIDAFIINKYIHYSI